MSTLQPLTMLVSAIRSRLKLCAAEVLSFSVLGMLVLGGGTGLLGCQTTAPDAALPDLRGVQLPAYVPGTTDSTTIPVRVMTYNIRYNNPTDTQWVERRGHVASMIRFHEPTVVGTQEGKLHQLMDLEKRLTGYERVGVGRKSGGGEFSALFYQTVRMELLEYDTFWLSEVPRTPSSMGWDAAFPRVVTWARFRDRITGTVFFVFNTHFDHKGKVSREESAKLIQKQIADIVDPEPVVLMGDFNAEPEDRPIELLTHSEAHVPLHDAMMAAETPHHGPISTFNGFEDTVVDDYRIDYIFTSPDVRVLRHGHLSDRWDGAFPSDHIPVLADLVF